MSGAAKKAAGAGGLSLYADLLDSDKQKAAGATISSAPVKYNIQKNGSGGSEEEALQKKKDGTVATPVLYFSRLLNSLAPQSIPQIPAYQATAGPAEASEDEAGRSLLFFVGT